MKEFQLEFVTHSTTLRWIKILNLFESFSVCKMEALAEATNSSARTITSDINSLRDYFKEAAAITSSNTGYQFELKDASKYLALKVDLVKNEPLFQIIESIFKGNTCTITEWADTLYLSVSTLTRYLTGIQPIIKRYNLRIGTSRVDLAGSEINIRQFFHDFLYESDITPHTILPSEEIQELTLNLNKHHFFDEYPFVSLGEFNYLVYIAVERFRQGKQVKVKPHILKILRNNIKPSFLAYLKALLIKYVQTAMTDEEIIYLYATLICKRSVLEASSEKKFCAIYNQWDFLVPLTEDYFNQLSPPSEGLEETKVFIQSFFTSIVIKQELSPTLNNNIEDVNNFARTNFPEEWLANFQFIKKFLSQYLPIDEAQIPHIAASLTIYIDSMQELYWPYHINIAFLLEGDHLIRQDIHVFVLKYLGKFQEVFFPDLIEFNSDYLTANEIDLVVTNSREYVSNYLKDTPYLIFKAIPDFEDWNRLIAAIKPRIAKSIYLSNKT